MQNTPFWVSIVGFTLTVRPARVSKLTFICIQVQSCARYPDEDNSKFLTLIELHFRFFKMLVATSMAQQFPFACGIHSGIITRIENLHMESK